MSAALLDVNVLIALMDPRHIHHDAAHQWFETASRRDWATCAVTQNAVVRILANDAYPTVDLRAEEAIAHLARFLSRAPHHRFWDHSVSLCDDAVFDRAHIQGHRQITDIYLAGVARVHGGRLATFDRSIPWRSIRGAHATLIEVLAA